LIVLQISLLFVLFKKNSPYGAPRASTLSLQYTVQYQIGGGTWGQVTPKIVAATWKDIAKVQRTSCSPSAQSRTPTYPACNSLW